MDVINPGLTYEGMAFSTKSSSSGVPTIVSQQGFMFRNGWNVLTIDSTTDSFQKFFTISHTDKSGCRISEIQLFGYTKGSVTPATDTLAVVSPGTIDDNNGNSYTTASITYSWSSTPFVTSMSPIVGRWSGGTQITINGFNFGTVIADVSVKINGFTCTIDSVTAI